MKKVFFLLPLTFLHLINFGQGFPMFSDSGRVWSTPQLFFRAHRETILSAGIRRCSVFYFLRENQTDSVLSKTIWFDASGNYTKSIFGSHPDQDFTDTCMYDSKNRVTEMRYMNGKKCFNKTKYSYGNDTIEIATYRNYYDGDTFYFPDKNKKHVMKVMKVGSDTGYVQRIYNRNNQLIRDISLDNKRNFLMSTEYLYDARGLPLKSYSVDRKKHKTNRFQYTYEFLNGQYTIMKWDDNGISLPASMVCVYQNNQCINCRQPYNMDVQFFYTSEGLLAEEKQISNNGSTVTFKYYYY